MTLTLYRALLIQSLGLLLKAVLEGSAWQIGGYAVVAGIAWTFIEDES